MKTYITYLLAFILCMIVPYIATSLILWEYNPGVWPIDARGLCFAIGTVLGVAFGIWLYNEKTKI